MLSVRSRSFITWQVINFFKMIATPPPHNDLSLHIILYAGGSILLSYILGFSHVSVRIMCGLYSIITYSNKSHLLTRFWAFKFNILNCFVDPVPWCQLLLTSANPCLVWIASQPRHPRKERSLFTWSLSSTSLTEYIRLLCLQKHIP